jgi:uncharacterized protein YbjQ (UPF0145 family)
MNILLSVLKCFFKQSTSKITASAQDVDAKLFRKRNDIVVAATAEIPHKEVKQVIGSVTGTSNTQVCNQQLFELAEKEARLDIIEKAQRLGANAIVNLKLTSGAYEPQASIWQISQAVYDGTAVIVA